MTLDDFTQAVVARWPRSRFHFVDEGLTYVARHMSGNVTIRFDTRLDRWEIEGAVRNYGHTLYNACKQVRRDARKVVDVLTASPKG